MPVQTKICGLSTPETLGAAIRGGASHVGFVFFAKSPRNLDFDKAAALAALVPAHVRKVGVVVNADDAFLDRAITVGKLDALQLHGSEPPERAAALKARHGIEVWKAIPVKTRADLAAAARYRAAVDRILYDAKTPDSADLPGGMGLRFDWKLLDGFAHPLPWALSGGLDARNLAEAVRITGAPLVDTSSGVESSPGVKDVDKIAAFLQSASQL
ncbi:N-(5'-phosphoribosyl)anthranilate isomerase [Sphingomonas sp. DBB INV C78]|uniref:phosphoribosylanthranilate isomerase n=1 Tax=Sphingomonas sp. DBB INV C78 TaxID=3349434 RepID=UPI0036D404C6